MGEPGMGCPRIDVMGESEVLYTAHPLEVGMGHHPEGEVVQFYEIGVYGIAYMFQGAILKGKISACRGSFTTCGCSVSLFATL